MVDFDTSSNVPFNTSLFIKTEFNCFILTIILKIGIPTFFYRQNTGFSELVADKTYIYRLIGLFLLKQFLLHPSVAIKTGQ